MLIEAKVPDLIQRQLRWFFNRTERSQRAANDRLLIDGTAKVGGLANIKEQI